ncbi:histidine phosphatase family protein [Bacillus tianshenii]|uniref:histidine phosphatase family protein n=1 Tax=Sutcliffiella tianshenii TaxID=1463404 RepID=UPI001CD1F56A|nr:histidine phosphatase family protein [Bacillus tianshenii]MCA1322201.1 histidine phosphatase family protein [Bacillus tianshenii]
MKVGLIRHFKVTRGYPDNRVTAEELLKWVEEYDASEVEENDLDLKNIDWKRCYSSDLPRAVKTAEKAFKGDITLLKELREITVAPIFPPNRRLPLKLHLLSIRMAWLFNHKSQPVSKRELQTRISYTLDKILSSKENTLIVSHGGVMMLLRKELLRRGFRGPEFKIANNGELYLFEKR